MPRDTAHVELPDLTAALQDEIMEWVVYYDPDPGIQEFFNLKTEVLEEFPQDGSPKHTFKDIDQERATVFLLKQTAWATAQGYQIAPISFDLKDPARRLIFTRRRRQRLFYDRMTPDGLVPVWHYTITIAGWQETNWHGENVKHLIAIMPGGGVVLGDNDAEFETPHNDPTDPEFYDPAYNPWDSPFLGGIVANMPIERSG